MDIWYVAESTAFPELVDSTSSRKWVYVRRNVKKCERENEQGIKETFYTFEEQKVSKEIWGIFEKEADNSTRLADVEDVLADLIGGVDID
jgi:hypothetical protein